MGSINMNESLQRWRKLANYAKVCEDVETGDQGKGEAKATYTFKLSGLDSVE